MALQRAPEPTTDPGHALLVQLLTEIRGVREAVGVLTERVGGMERAHAAHPPADALQEALARLKVLEAREEGARNALSESRGDMKALHARVEALERDGARGGVTLTGVHKVAAAALGLITLALVGLVGYLWRR